MNMEGCGANVSQARLDRSITMYHFLFDIPLYKLPSKYFIIGPAQYLSWLCEEIIHLSYNPQAL